MKRILLLSRGGNVGGSQRQLSYLLEDIDRQRYEPIVVCTDAGPFVDRLRQSCSVHVRRLRPWRKPLLALLRNLDARWLTRLADKSNIDLVYCSDLWLSGYALRVASRLRRPVVLHVRAPMDPRRLEKHGCNRADAVIAISPRASRRLLDAGVPESRISMIYDGVDIREFRPKPQILNVLRRDFPHAGGTLVGLVGRIRTSKRPMGFLESANRLLGAGYDATFFIIGSPDGTCHHREVRQFATESGLGSRVIFTDRRDDMADVLASLDVLVTLSGGSVMIEAMAAGTPVISAGFTPPDESTIVLNEQTGLVVSDDDLDQAIARLINQPDYRAKLAAAARRHAETHFDHHEMVNQTQQVFDRLLSAGPA